MMLRGRRIPMAASVVLGVLAAMGCSTAPLDASARLPDVAPEAAPAAVSTSRVATSVITAPELMEATEAAQVLDSLRVTSRQTPQQAGYERGAFGRGWGDTDGNGCNQRDDVLLRDGVPGTVRVLDQGRCDHDVVAGEWIDPYTGERLVFDDLKDLTQAQGVQIDHVIPLAEAWVSGASEWTEEQRREFSDDLDALMAVDGPTNASKSAADPAAWRPTKSFQCGYARRWIGIKARWDLAVDESEKHALTEMLGYCAA